MCSYASCEVIKEALHKVELYKCEELHFSNMTGKQHRTIMNDLKAIINKGFILEYSDVNALMFVRQSAKNLNPETSDRVEIECYDEKWHCYVYNEDMDIAEMKAFLDLMTDFTAFKVSINIIDSEEDF